jgi:hypothetical protein
MKKLSKTVNPIHFEDLDGSQFERLVFAYHARAHKWRSLEWYGQAGSDLGRDIWGVRDDGTADGESMCIQCVNRKNLTFAKAEQDTKKVLKAPSGIPKRFRIVARSTVSAKMRDRIKAHLTNKGVTHCDVWSGAEFEELVRTDAEALLKRFFEGEEFPDAAPDLAAFARALDPADDNDALAVMARLFDRPAFYTPILQESSLPDFKQAITDTIQALGTGIWKARDGHVIARITSRQQLKDADLRRNIEGVEKALAKLRAKFDEMTKSGLIRNCNCDQPECPIYFMSHEAAHELERLRRNALALFHDAYPPFVHPTW